jgi:hypothetical protein
MEECPICGGRADSCAFNNADSIGAERKYHLCHTCEHLFLLPVPDEKALEAHYAGATTEVSRHYPRAYARRLRRLGGIIRPYLPRKPSRYLEIGPGSIGIVPLLQKGDEYHAIEPGQENRKRLAAALSQGDVQGTMYRATAELQSVECDVAIIMSCLEHVPSPVQTVADASKHLSPGGTLIFGSPIQELEYADLQVLGGKIRANGDHLHSFSEKSARALMERTGFDCLTVDSLCSKTYLRAAQALKRPLRDYVRTNRILSAPVQLRMSAALAVSGLLTATVRLRGAADYDFVVVAKKR